MDNFVYPLSKEFAQPIKLALTHRDAFDERGNPKHPAIASMATFAGEAGTQTKIGDFIITTEDWTGEGPFADFCKLTCNERGIAIDWHVDVGRSMYSTPRKLELAELFKMLGDMCSTIDDVIENHDGQDSTDIRARHDGVPR